jgi:hypothetical protein
MSKYPRTRRLLSMEKQIVDAASLSKKLHEIGFDMWLERHQAIRAKAVNVLNDLFDEIEHEVCSMTRALYRRKESD